MQLFDLDALLGRGSQAVVAQSPPQVAVNTISGAVSGCYAIAELSDQDYHHRTAGISTSGLKEMLRSPAHYQAYKRNQSEETASRRMGRAIHAWVLERRIFFDKFAVWNGGRRYGSAFDEFVAKHPDKTILSADEMVRVTGAGDALVNCDEFPLKLLLEDGTRTHTEFSVFWNDEETGVQLKARFDLLCYQRPVFGFDVKSTDDAREHSFVNQIGRLHYDLQAAVYMEAMKHFTGEYGPFFFGAVEVKDPFGVQIYTIEPQKDDYIENGRKKLRYALQLYADCLAKDKWPSYPKVGVIRPQMLPWQKFYLPGGENAVQIMPPSSGHVESTETSESDMAEEVAAIG